MVRFRGFNVEPGNVSIQFKGQDPKILPYVHADDKQTFVMDGSQLKKIQHNSEDLDSIDHKSIPKRHKIAAVVDSSKHSLIPADGNIQSLTHGMNLNEPGDKFSAPDKGNVFQTKAMRWGVGGDGRRVLIKPLDDESLARKEAAYSSIARNFFGLGDHVPTTAAISHPRSGKGHVVSEYVDGKHLSDNPKGSDADRVAQLGDSGHLDKLGIMDYIVNHSDRHPYNYLLGDDGHLKMLDNESAFDIGNWSPLQKPHYLDVYENVTFQSENRQIHPNTISWVRSLDPKELHRQILQSGFSRKEALQATRRLRHLQSMPDRVTAEQLYSDPNILVVP